MRSLDKWLWVVQALLALLFLFAGGMKLVMPAEALAQMPLPGTFMRFIGVVEVAGALGLVLPGLLHVKPWLTPLAAAGLVTVMIGAVVVSAAFMGAKAAVTPLVVGLLAAFVAYGRTRAISRPQVRQVRTSTERPVGQATT